MSDVKLPDMPRDELVHDSPMMKLEEFLQAIDSTGGWPVGYTHVSFYHAIPYSGRVCKFTNVPINTGWWTVVCSADDYYWWKLTEVKRTAVMAEARQQLIRQLR